MDSRPHLLPVPWIRWQRFRIDGVVREAGSGRPLPGLLVRAFDKDLLKDDFLGECETDAEGRFTIHFTDADFKDVVESQPDLYLCVFEPGASRPILNTAVRDNATPSEYFEVEVPPAELRAALRR